MFRCPNVVKSKFLNVINVIMNYLKGAHYFTEEDNLNLADLQKYIDKINLDFELSLIY